MTAFFMSVYPSFHTDAEQMRALIAGIPLAAQKAFNLNLDAIFTLLGYFAYILPYVLLCTAVQAMNLGLSVVSKETSQKTIDFLLSKPVLRSTVLHAKLLAVLVMIVLTDLVYIPAALAIASAVADGPYNHQTFFLLCLTILFTQLFFVIAGVLVGVVVPKTKSVTAVSLSTAFIFFILNLFGSVIGNAAIRYLTPFKFYDATYIILHGTYEWNFALWETIIVFCALVASYVIYVRRDIEAV